MRHRLTLPACRDLRADGGAGLGGLPRRRHLASIAAVVVLALSAGVVLAEGGYDLSWWTVAGGGSGSSGGSYTLSGTIGQADAGAMSGGSYTLAGGFWGGGPAVSPPAFNQFVYLPFVRR